MAEYYLDFEKPLKSLDEEILELETREINHSNLVKLETLRKKRDKKLKKIFSQLSRWQKVQLARHPKRPYTMDYINYLAPNFIELHGDRHFCG